MAMTRVEPVEVRVRTDWLSGRPREIRWGDRTIPVTAIAAVRRERSRLSDRDRPAHHLRGGHARGAHDAHLPPPRPALARRGPGPGRRPGGLTRSAGSHARSGADLRAALPRAADLPAAASSGPG